MIIGRPQVKISVFRLTILTDVFVVFIRQMIGIVPPINYSSFLPYPGHSLILSFDAVIKQGKVGDNVYGTSK